MKDSELDKILKAAKAPERSEEFWAQFPRRVTSRLHWKSAARETESRHWFPRLAWTFAVAAACLLIGFMLGHRRGQRDTLAENGLLQNEKVIQEMLAMFPNRVRAVVQDDHGLNLVLSDNADVPVSAPLWVKVCDGNHCSAMVTFSGQQIQIGHQNVTVLTDPEGRIILEGDNFLWSNGQTMLAQGKLKIEAKTLGSI